MRSTGIVDSHLHLQDYEPETDIAGIVNEAVEAGVSLLVCNGTEEADWEMVLGFARAHPQVLPCFGVHPWFTGRLSDSWLSNLEGYLQAVPSGVGEIGLDRLREPVDKIRQEEAFRAQLDIARRLDRPAMVHCVRAWGWLMDILRSEPRLPRGILLHSYGGSADLVKPLADMGVYFSFSGKVLFDAYHRARQAVIVVPPDRLLIETDAPCMLPPDKFKAKSIMASDGEEYNHPANLPLILRGIAGLLEMSPYNLAERLRKNAERFFEPILGAPSPPSQGGVRGG